LLLDNDAIFKERVAQYPYGNFILVSGGTNQVRCIYSCFVVGELGKPSKVVCSLGSRPTSPFKTLNTIEHTVKPFSGHRTTRASEEKGEEAWISTMKVFKECNIIEVFKNLRSAEDFPAINFWACAQSFWIHPNVFEVLDANNSHGAGKVANKIMTALDSEILDQVPSEETHYLMLFL
jgi:hypothetical protein